MQNKKSFKENNSLEERRILCQQYIQGNENKILIILEKNSKCKLQLLNRPEVMTDKNKTVLELSKLLQQKLEYNYSLFLYSNKKLLNFCDNLGEIYEKDKDEDGFLYITYHDQETMG